MRVKLLFLLTIILLVSGCVSSREPDSEQKNRFVQLQTQQGLNSKGIEIIGMTSVLRPGDTGSITIKGKPGVRYSITASYRLRRHTVSENVRAFMSKDSGTDGKVNWTWKVNINTEPGTYPIAISGGRKSLKTTYTVVR